ncbi:hypothetical protein PYW07_014963 [Mythimna separata]|uniref:Uncharacterized protein n=1 Tax=Mythimna separata TaxID=271217 RepID=A0AAD7Z293_MYTSE|nr:hypothetical protein PYW07_014963 [Mythimna separata]
MRQTVRAAHTRSLATVTMRTSAAMFLAILVYATMLWRPCDCYYKYGTERRMGGARALRGRCSNSHACDRQCCVPVTATTMLWRPCDCYYKYGKERRMGGARALRGRCSNSHACDRQCCGVPATATTMLCPCDCYYKYGTERRMGGKLTRLTRELLLDVEMKVQAIQGYRDQYYKSLQYQLGDTVFEMRDFFKKMVRIYQMTHRDISYRHGNYHRSLEALVEIQRMAMDIETRVTMVQGWQYKRETKEEHRERMLSPLRSGAPRDADDDAEPLREAAARVRMLQRLPARARPRPRAPSTAPPRRPNKKWRHVTNNDFSLL